MNLIVIRKNGEKYVFGPENDFIVRSFSVSPPQYKTDSEELDGRHGEIDKGTTIKSRTLDALIFFKSYDAYDFPLKRNEIYQWLDSREEFYVIDDREPGKRWIAKVESHSLDQIVYNAGEFEVTFKCFRPFAESIGTTLDPMTFDSDLWQIGQGLVAEDLLYKTSASSFKIYNAGDVMINPREMPLIIRVFGVNENLSIRNATTNDFWVYFGSSTSADDVIELNGVRSLKNGQSIFSKTNYNLIRIAPGWNDFQIGGVGGGPFQIEFDFRFYYL